VLNGISISAVQPSLTIFPAASHTPSQLRLMLAVPPRTAAFTFVEDLLFELRAERRRHEHVAVSRIVERVEDHLEVVLVEQPVRIAAHFGRRHGQRREGAECR
jgi:hypothetical protein